MPSCITGELEIFHVATHQIIRGCFFFVSLCSGPARFTCMALCNISSIQPTIVGAVCAEFRFFLHAGIPITSTAFVRIIFYNRVQFSKPSHDLFLFVSNRFPASLGAVGLSVRWSYTHILQLHLCK